VQDSIQEYLAARARLTQLRVLRSERSVAADYAEWLVARSLRLTLAESTIQEAYDAADANGKTYQIKSRIVRNLDANTSFDFRDPSKSFDYLACVFFSPNLQLLGVARVPCDMVRETGRQTKSTFRFRWNKRVASDPRIEKFLWSEVNKGVAIPIAKKRRAPGSPATHSKKVR
jgi:hypothetical protein